MKINLLIPFLFFAAVFSGCKKDSVPAGIPSCIKEEISKIEAEPVRNPAGSVWQYQYNGNTVYYIPSYCCDVYGEVFNTNCQVICAPDGGMSGSGDGRCADFFEKRTGEKLIWKDDRE